MIELPPRWTVDDVRLLDPAVSFVWASDRSRAWAEAQLGLPTHEIAAPLPDTVTTVVAVGGGSLIDDAKTKARDGSRRVRVVAIPTIWGSGAEASRIAVHRVEGRRQIDIDDELVPDAIVYVDEFAATVPPERARDACGDVWAHAIEGFASPLADHDLRVELSTLINQLLDTPAAPDPAWFELSGRACAGQARSGVGLVHGIAHVVEDALPANGRIGHARLCRLLLAPVLDLDRRAEKWAALFAGHGIDLGRVEAVVGELFDRDAYTNLLPLVVDRWLSVLRDPCTRTNAVLVRKSDLAVLEAWGRP